MQGRTTVFRLIRSVPRAASGSSLDVQLPLLAAASAALAPGIHAWWTGRTLIARTTDPAFAELLLARRMRGIQVMATAIALLIVFAAPHTVWTLPLLAIGTLVGGFSFRRALYSETWAIFDYVNYATASVIGGAGFWLLLGFGPRLILALTSGWLEERPMVGAAVLGTVCAIALFAWERRYSRVWLAAHRATPLERRDLIDRFEEICRRAGVPLPGVFRYGAAGSYSMNAVALPSVREPRVAFGDTLLEMMDADEVTAIFAHELSHLEQYDAKAIMRLRSATTILIVTGMALPVAALRYLPSVAGAVALVWPMLVLGILVHRLSRSQAHESDSDRRSAALVGDPEAMIRALTKLHHYSRIPRRWPHDFERSASHPSLARRIQALRGECVIAPPTIAAPAVLRTTAAGRWIALDATRIYWFDGVPDDVRVTTGDASAPSLAVLRERAASYRAVAYADLVELRVGVVGTGRVLHGRDRAGKKWSTPLHTDDVAAAQIALDALDGQLAPRSARDRAKGMRPLVAIVVLGLLLSITAVLRGLRTKDVQLAWTPGTVEDVARFALPQVAFDLELSPSGRRVAVRTADSTSEGSYYDEEALVPWQYVVADSSGIRRTTTAYALAIASDDAVLAIRAATSSRDSLELSLESAMSGDSITWRRTIPAFGRPAIHIDRATGRWAAFGQEGDDGDIVVVSGTVASDTLEIRRESYMTLGGLPLYAYPDGAMLVARLASPDRPMFLTVLGILTTRWEILRVDDGEAEILGSLPGFPECKPAGDATGLLCVVHGRKRSVWRINDDRTLTSFGRVPGEFDLWSVADDGHLLAGSRTTGVLALMNLETRSATRLWLRAEELGISRFVTGAAESSGMLAAVINHERESELILYRVR